MSTDRRVRILRWIEEQEALCEAATPGPWKTDAFYVVAEVPTGRPGGEVIVQALPTVGRLEMDLPTISNAALIASSRTGYPLALAALRAEATAHQPVDVPTGADDYLSICDACSCDYDDETPCPTIDRLFCSLGLQDSGR